MKQCRECGTTIPKDQKRKFCRPACLQADMARYWRQPPSHKKRWYGPIPSRPALPKKKRDVLPDIEAGIKRVERLLTAEGIDLQRI